MARVHYWHYLLNEEGQPVPDAVIGVLEAGTQTYLWIYDNELSGTAFCNYEKTGTTPSTDGNPQIRTNSDGYFEFWVADSSDISRGYSGIKLKITWSKPGIIDDGGIDNIEFTVLLRVFSSTITNDSWSASGGQFYNDVPHSLGNMYPVAMLYDESTTLSEPITAGFLNTTTTRIYRNTNTDCRITLIG
jgi:hypothetical protein